MKSTYPRCCGGGRQWHATGVAGRGNVVVASWSTIVLSGGDMCSVGAYEME